MPYIDAERRKRIDAAARDLAAAIILEHNKIDHGGNGEAACLTTKAGLLNYAITTLILRTMGDIKYWKIALLTGVLENVKQELYRRMASPYEDKKCAENGDVYGQP